VKEQTMPRGDKSKYTPAQKRKAQHIEESYEERGLDEREAAARAWATVNKQTGGGERSGGGRRTSSRRKTRARKDSARRAVATKHGHSPNRGRMTARRAHHSST
jgi:plasmid stabilization system protein ParE